MGNSKSFARRITKTILFYCRGVFASIVLVIILALQLRDAVAVPIPSSTNSPNSPTIITFSIISAAHGARILHAVYPHAAIRVEGGANAVVVIASPDDVAYANDRDGHRRQKSDTSCRRYGPSPQR